MMLNRYFIIISFIISPFSNAVESLEKDHKKTKIVEKNKTKKQDNKTDNINKDKPDKIVIQIEPDEEKSTNEEQKSVGIEKDIRNKIDFFLKSYESIIGSFNQEIIINNQIKRSSGSIFIKKPSQLKLSVAGSDGKYNIIMNKGVGVHYDLKTKQMTYLDDMSVQQMKSYISFEDLNIFDPRILVIKSGSDVIITLPTLDEVTSAFVFNFEEGKNIFIKEINQTGKDFTLKINFSNIIINEDLPDVIFEIKDPRLKDNGL